MFIQGVTLWQRKTRLTAVCVFSQAWQFVAKPEEREVKEVLKIHSHRFFFLMAPGLNEMKRLLKLHLRPTLYLFQGKLNNFEKLELTMTTSHLPSPRHPPPTSGGCRRCPASPSEQRGLTSCRSIP